MNHYNPLLFKALRKYYSINQIELAKILNVTQGSVSKIESGTLEISATQWIILCEKFDVSPYSMMGGGFLDIGISSPKQSFKIPKKYLVHTCIKNRFLSPILFHLKNELTEIALVNILNALGIKLEYFLIVDNKINLVFLVDFLACVKEKHPNLELDIKTIVNNFPYYQYWDVIKETTIKQLYKSFKSDLYEKVNYNPKDSGNELSFEFSSQNDFLEDYTKNLLSHIQSISLNLKKVESITFKSNISA